MSRRPTPSRGESPVFTPAEAADYLRVVSEPTLASWRNRPPRGGGPRFIKAGGKIAYLREDLDEWLRSRRALSTTSPLPASASPVTSAADRAGAVTEQHPGHPAGAGSGIPRRGGARG